MNNRRGFLKALGIGSVIAPIGTAGLLEQRVRLVEPAKVEAIEAMPDRNELDLMSSMNLGGELQVLYKSHDGNVFKFEAKTFITECRTEMIDVTIYSDNYFSRLPASTRCEWQLKGVIVESWRMKWA